MIEIHIESAIFSDAGLRFLRRLGLNKEDVSKITTFVHFDFFDFETQVSCLGIGQKPVFNCTSKFKVYTDDFFLQYLQSQATNLSFCLSNGLEFITIATCPIIMKELTDPDRTDRLRYYADLVSTHDGKTLIGKIDYGLKAHIPMAQAIRAYKERTVALNLLTVSDPKISTRRFNSRAEINELNIKIIKCNNLKPPRGSKACAVFASVQIYIHEDLVTETVRDSTNPLFNFLRILPIPMTADLDRYLRTSELNILISQDNTNNNPDFVDHLYGVCRLSLMPLALGEKIEGEFDIIDDFGYTVGSITLSLSWSKQYRLDVIPIVSKLDEKLVSNQSRRNLIEAPPEPSLHELHDKEESNHNQPKNESNNTIIQEHVNPKLARETSITTNSLSSSKEDLVSNTSKTSSHSDHHQDKIITSKLRNGSADSLTSASLSEKSNPSSSQSIPSNSRLSHDNLIKPERQLKNVSEEGSSRLELI